MADTVTPNTLHGLIERSVSDTDVDILQIENEIASLARLIATQTSNIKIIIFKIDS
jgi:hypothetical protein